MRSMTATATALLLAACGGGAETANSTGEAATGTAAAREPVKLQPGSWTPRVQLTELDMGSGVDSAQFRSGMQAAFDAASGRGVCVSAAAAAQGDMAANMERMAAQGRKCDFTRKVHQGERVDFAGVCTDAAGAKVRIAIAGTSGATAQDITIRTEQMEPVQPGPRLVAMRMQNQRTGECKPGDIQAPTPGAPAAS